MTEEQSQSAKPAKVGDAKRDPATGRFGKGNNANPGGRPKRNWLTDALREVFEEDGLEGAKDLIRKQIEMVHSGEKGSDNVLRQLWDRSEGTVTQKTEHVGDMRTLIVLEDANMEEPAMPEGLTASEDAVQEEPDEEV